MKSPNKRVETENGKKKNGTHKKDVWHTNI